jgi:hypothetical protein
MPDGDDVTARDALAIAQRALGKVNDVDGRVDAHDDEIEALREQVTALELRLSEIDDDRDAGDLTLDEKIGAVREHAFEKANDGHGKAKLDYSAIKWEVFDGEIGQSTCYRLIRRAAGLDEAKTGSAVGGFTARDPSDGNYHLAVDADAAKRSRVFSGGKKPSTEGGA